MKESTRIAALAHAWATFPRESCGLVVIRKGRERYWACRNQSAQAQQFVIDPQDYAAADMAGAVTAVVHSHPNLPAIASQADRVACETTGLAWHIVSLPNAKWCTITPTGYEAPLVGREWCHGVLDCYTLVRDWFKHERCIDLPDFSRTHDWWLKGQSLYLENFAKAGFSVTATGSLSPGDCLLMQVGSPVPNHAAVYLGDGLILHHLQDRLSSRDVYGGYWQKITTHVLRHQGL